MIAYHDALRRLLDGVTALPRETVEACDAIGRVLAAPLHSPEALPPFDNSAMDGFALRAGGTTIAAGREFDVVGGSAAGDGASTATAGAWEIMTGARMPDGLDAIVPIEQVDVQATAHDRPSRIRLRADVAPGQHLRRTGSDIERGEMLADTGTAVDAPLRMLCAAVGVATLDVTRRPRVALINTGRELVDDPRRVLAAGEIRNSNGPFLATRVAAAGAELLAAFTVADDVDAFIAAIAALPEVDLIISTGAVSMGRFDFVPAALGRLGASTLFHKAAIRPGKPILAARLPSGAVFVGLPGNPASTAVGFRFFAEPLLRAWLGMPGERLLRLPLRAPFAKRVPLRMHLKARVVVDADARLGIEILGGQESFRIRPLLEANAWAIVPADIDVLDAGAWVEVASPCHLQALTVSA